MKFAITVGAKLPVQQFLVIESETEEEAIKILREAVNPETLETLEIISIEPITDEEFQVLSGEPEEKRVIN